MTIKFFLLNFFGGGGGCVKMRDKMAISAYIFEKSTMLAELAYNNLLFRHFQLFIFSSVVCVSQLCLGLTLLLKCRVHKLGQDYRLLVLFDRFDRFILFWRDLKFARSIPLCKSFRTYGTKKRSIPSFERTFFIASQGST